MRVGTRGASVLPVLLAAAAATSVAWAQCPPEQAAVIRAGKQAFTVEVAQDDASRIRGLSGRAGLDAGSGMWFILPGVDRHGFWMREMRFPIDLVWVGPDARVLAAVTLPVCKQDPCPVSYPPAPAAYVLEVPARSFHGKAGEKITWQCR